MIKPTSVFIVFVFSLLAFFQTAAQDRYVKGWKRVDSLMQQAGLTQTAGKEVDALIKQARTEKNAPQLIRGLQYKLMLDEVKQENALAISIARFEKEFGTAQEPARSVLASLTAETYWRYLQQNRYRLYDLADATPFDKNDLATWSINDLTARITQLYQRSIASKTILQRTPVAAFDAIIEKGNARKLRPTMYDLLAFRALEYFQNDEPTLIKPAEQFKINTPEFFDAAGQFARLELTNKDTSRFTLQALKIYQQLVRFHLSDKDPSALVDADIARIAFVYQHSTLENKEKLYLKALTALRTAYPSLPAADQASFLIAARYAEQADGYDPLGDTTHRFDYNKALELCEEVLAQKHLSEGSSNCLELKNRIMAPSLRHTVEKVNVIDAPFRMLVEYKNVNQISYRILKLDQALQDSIQERIWDPAFWKKLASLPAIVQQKYNLPDTRDHQAHRLEIPVEALPSGDYGLLAVSGETFTPDSIHPMAISRFSVSNLAFIQSKNDYYVVNRNTGQPIKDASAIFYKQVFNKITSRQEWIETGRYTSDDKGFFRVTPETERNYEQKRVQFRSGTDYLTIDAAPIYYAYEEDADYDAKDREEYETDMRKLFLFTDRRIYRPGQELFFKGLLVTKDFKTKKPQILGNRPLKFYLTDANQQDIDSLELTSNEFGTVKGRFKIPAGRLNGQFSIHEEEIDASVNFSVEEYKRPRFLVELKKPEGSYRVNDTIQVLGSAKAFAGNMLNNAKVVYRVVRTTRIPFWTRQAGMNKIWPPYRGEQTEITNGISQTNAAGEFRISFKAIPDEAANPKYYPEFNYEVSADITDINGETHSQTIQVAVGYQAITVDLDVPGRVPTDSLNKLNVTTRNLNGLFEKSALQVTLTRLQEPASVYRNRYWQQPDLFIIPEPEYRHKFPLDVYRNEDDPSNWKQLETAYSKMDSSAPNAQFSIDKQFVAGWYLLKVKATGKSGDSIVRNTVIQLTGKTAATGPAYSVIETGKNTVVPSEKIPYTFSSNLKDLYVLTQCTLNDSSKPARIRQVQERFSDVTDPIADYGIAKIEMAFVKNNRFYSDFKLIFIPDSSKSLSIVSESFRNKLLPGSKETWKVKVAGLKGDKVAAEILTGAYDLSLDQFVPHAWNIPDIWTKPYPTGNFQSPNNFEQAISQNRYVQVGNPGLFQVVYDRIPGIYEFRNTVRLRGMVSKAEALQGAVPGVAVLNEDVVVKGFSGARVTTSQKIADTTLASSTPPPPVQPLRKNFNETAFFFPQLATDKEGNTEFTFTMPEALTSWKWMTLAHTKDLAFGYKEQQFITQKDLMVQPNLPRFLREGDRVDISTKIVNLGTREMTGQVELQLIDPETNQSVDGWFRNVFPNQYFTVGAGQSSVASFSLEIPFEYARPVIYRFYARSDSTTDGEEGIIPVLLNKVMVTETATLPLLNQQTKQVKLQKLLNSGGSETLTNHSLTIEFTSNPAWFAVQALPSLTEIRDGSSEQVFYAFYAGALSRKIAEANPTIAEIFSKWKISDTSMRSKLEQNESLKAILLQQTPWVLEAKNESQTIEKLAQLFQFWHMQQHLLDAVHELKSLQHPNGSFSWMRGGADDRFVTQNIISGIGRLIQLKALNSELLKELMEIAVPGIRYLDSQLAADYDRQKKSASKTSVLDPMQIQYLYMRSLFPSVAVPGTIFNAYNYYRKLSTTTWVPLNRQLQGLLALALYRTGDSFNARKILRSLQENALFNEELGMYWKDAAPGYSWYHAGVSTQSVMIEAFAEIGKDTSLVEKLKVWLIKNKQTNSWNGDKSTADACYALLSYGANWLGSSPEVEIRAGALRIAPTAAEQQAGTGYFKRTIDGPKIKPDMGDIQVFVKSGRAPQPMYGAVYWQYMEDLDRITASKGPVNVVKRLFIQSNSPSGPVYEELRENATLKIGDKIKVRLEFRTDRSMDYVHLSDMRASGMEPLSTLSGYTWKGGIGYYQVTRDASSDFYIDHLPKGTFVIEYGLVVNSSGSFTNGISTVQCMYAPEFTGHTQAIRVHIEQ